jgi:predicted Fe-Mo cluster-binding NifX family protein
MLTVITSKGNDKNSMLELRFGRAAWFCIFREETGETEFVKNMAASQESAGIRAARYIHELGAGKVISGDFGHKAAELLEAKRIQMVLLHGQGLTIGDIIDKLNKGLKKTSSK